MKNKNQIILFEYYFKWLVTSFTKIYNENKILINN